MKIKILTDSSSDLPLEYVEDNKGQLEVIGMPVTIGEKSYVDDLGKSFSHDIFYEELTKGSPVTTSQINVMTFFERFKHLEAEGYAVIYIGLSSGLSGTIQNAYMAKNMLEEEIGQVHIEIVDSLAASIGLGALVIKALELSKAETDIKLLVNQIEKEKLKANHWFVVDDLMHLKNGGRIPATLAYVGTMLKVKPLLSMDSEGKLLTYAKVRGRAKAKKYILDKVEEYLADSQEMVLVGHANMPQEAVQIQEELKKRDIKNPVMTMCLSATIASHVGPGMMAIAFMGASNRTNK